MTQKRKKQTKFPLIKAFQNGGGGIEGLIERAVIGGGRVRVGVGKGGGVGATH